MPPTATVNTKSHRTQNSSLSIKWHFSFAHAIPALAQNQIDATIRGFRCAYSMRNEMFWIYSHHLQFKSTITWYWWLDCNILNFFRAINIFIFNGCIPVSLDWINQRINDEEEGWRAKGKIRSTTTNMHFFRNTWTDGGGAVAAGSVVTNMIEHDWMRNICVFIENLLRIMIMMMMKRPLLKFRTWIWLCAINRFLFLLRACRCCCCCCFCDGWNISLFLHEILLYFVDNIPSFVYYTNEGMKPVTSKPILWAKKQKSVRTGWIE